VPVLGRRKFLRGAGSVAGLSIGLWGVRSEFVAAQTVEPRVVDLGGDFHVLTIGESNVLAVGVGDGLALVDGGAPDHSAALLERAEALPGAGKVHTLFNTHWHPEQTGSNEALGKAGARIISQENTRLWLTTDVTWPWNGQTVQPLPKLAQPNETFYTDQTFTVGHKTVRCGYLRDCPHTDGDIYVFFPDDNVLAAGGAVTGKGWPSIDWWTGGWIGGIVGGLDALLTVVDSQTRIVPAEGPVLAKADLEKQHEMYGAIWERLAKTLYGGGGTQEALAAEPTKEFIDVMGPSDDFVVRAFHSMWAYLSPDA
jgi:cyclase